MHKGEEMTNKGGAVGGEVVKGQREPARRQLTAIPVFVSIN